MTTTAQTEETLRRLVRGGIEGACIGSVIVMLLRVLQEGGLRGRPLLLAALAGAALGGCLGMIGRGLGRGLTGTLVGAVLGLFLGGLIGEHFDAPTPAAGTTAEQGAETSASTLDIVGPTLDGRQFDLKELRGKVVLVDFWATWCVPCVAEMPNLLDVYERYHSRGFEIVGISLDYDKERLRRFVKEKKIPWPQIIFDDEKQQGGQNPIARKYDVVSIPSTALLDPQGRVVATELRGRKLEIQVASLLGEPAPSGTELSQLAQRMLRLGTNSRGFILAVLTGGLLGGLAGALVERSARKPLLKATASGPDMQH